MGCREDLNVELFQRRSQKVKGLYSYLISLGKNTIDTDWLLTFRTGDKVIILICGLLYPLPNGQRPPADRIAFPWGSLDGF